MILLLMSVSSISLAANTINLKPGESITIFPGKTTNINCADSPPPPPPPEPVVCDDNNLCECVVEQKTYWGFEMYKLGNLISDSKYSYKTKADALKACNTKKIKIPTCY